MAARYTARVGDVLSPFRSIRRYVDFAVIDTSRPQAKFMSAAFWQLGMLETLAKLVTIADDAHRVFFHAVGFPCFIALRWVNDNHFSGSVEIHKSIDSLEKAFEKLVRRHAKHSSLTSIETNACPVCDAKLFCPGKVVEHSFCSDCFMEEFKPAEVIASRAFGSDH